MSKNTRNTPPAASSSAASRKSSAGKKTDAVKTPAARTAAAKAAPATAAATIPAVAGTPTASQLATALPTLQSAIAFPVLSASDLAGVSAREVVFTVDGWKSLQVLSSSEAPAAFHPDRVLLTGVAPGTEVEFAVHLRFGSQGIWLNNGGRNYRQISG